MLIDLDRPPGIWKSAVRTGSEGGLSRTLEKRPWPADALADPRARVDAFIADYTKHHTRVVKTKVDRLELWEGARAEIGAAHFTGNRAYEHLFGFEQPSPHVPGKELIVDVKSHDGRVFVESRIEKHGLKKWCEYELAEVAGEWRIARIRNYLVDAAAPFMTDPDMARFQNPPEPPAWGPLYEEEIGFDGNLAFAVGREVTSAEDKGVIEVRPIGTLNCTSGALVVGDLGYDPRVLYLLRHQVAPGLYPAEVAVAFDRNAALRVRLSDESAVSWHAALKSGRGHVVGVDAGNVAILDLSAVMGVNGRDKERAFERFADLRGGMADSTMLSLVHADDTVIADSGWGDGVYPPANARNAR